MKNNQLAPRLILFLILAASLLILASGCEQSGRDNAAIIVEEETIAVVNSKKISLSEFQTRLQFFLSNYENYILDSDKNSRKIRDMAIENIIREELILQEASRRGITVNDTELETVSTEALTPYPGANFNRYLKAKNLTEEQWKNKLRIFLTKKKLITQDVIEQIPVTKREINSYYKKNRNKFVQKKSYRVRHIAVSTQDEAEAIHHQLLRGASFIKLVRKYSKSPDKAGDGNLGFITKGMLPIELETAIFKMSRANKISPIVQSQHGYHIFKLEKIRRYKRLKLAKVKKQIKQALIREKQDAAYQKWIAKLKKRASISVDQGMLYSDEGF